MKTITTYSELISSAARWNNLTPERRSALVSECTALPFGFVDSDKAYEALFKMNGDTLYVDYTENGEVLVHNRLSAFRTHNKYGEVNRCILIRKHGGEIYLGGKLVAYLTFNASGDVRMQTKGIQACRYAVALAEDTVAKAAEGSMVARKDAEVICAFARHLTRAL